MGRKDVARVTDSPLRPSDPGLPLARGGFLLKFIRLQCPVSFIVLFFTVDFIYLLTV
jgi:hypothetical protein